MLPLTLATGTEIIDILTVFICAVGWPTHRLPRLISGIAVSTSGLDSSRYLLQSANKYNEQKAPREKKALHDAQPTCK